MEDSEICFYPLPRQLLLKGWALFMVGVFLFAMYTLGKQIS